MARASYGSIDPAASRLGTDPFRSVSLIGFLFRVAGCLRVGEERLEGELASIAAPVASAQAYPSPPSQSGERSTCSEP
jgi:hypothetical protein